MTDLHRPLHATITGSGPRLALVHGFTQTGRCWGPIAEDLGTDHELVLVDAPGHGGSAGVETDLAEGGRMIADAAGAATYVGYSMGGRFVLHTALARPEVVRGVVLIGATAGLESADERRARMADDEARAARIEQIGVGPFLDEWLALPLFAGLSADASCREQRLENTSAGLASSLRLAGAGTQEPTWDRLRTIDAPVLVVAGDDDEKFTALAHRLVDAIGPNASFAGVPGAGHTAHLEQPELFIDLIRPWLSGHGL